MNNLVELDARIKDLESELRQLKTRRNALTPLCRLPDELLVEIIRYLQIKDHTRYEVVYDKQWTRITYACTHVREVAKAARPLWSLIRCSQEPRWMDLCLERCGDTPIHLFIKQHYYARSSDTPAVELAKDHFTRCRTAYIHINSNGQASELTAMLEQSAPLLTELLVRSYKGPRLTSKFLGGGAPLLKSLVLRELSGLEVPPSLPALEQLELSTAWMKDRSALTRLLTFLANSPALQEVTVMRPSPWENIREFFDDDCHLDPIKLPKLRLLCIHDDIKIVHMLLRALPDPAIHLEIVVLSRFRHQTDNPEIWSPPTSTYFAPVEARVSSFWNSRTGRTRLPNGRIQSDNQSSKIIFCSPESDRKGKAYVSYSSPCYIQEHHPLLDDIRTLHLTNDQAGPGSDDDGSGAVYLSNIKKLIIGRAWTDKYLKALEKWIKRHAKAHGAIQRVHIWHPARKLKDKVDAFVGRLQKVNAVVDIAVEWEPERVISPVF
jgi:hypothetical protein